VVTSGAAGFWPLRWVIWCPEEDDDDDAYRGAVEWDTVKREGVDIGRFYNHLALSNLPGETQVMRLAGPCVS